MRLAYTLLTLTLGLVACAPAAPPTADFAPGALIGIWTRADPERGQLYLTFNASGNYFAAHGEPSGGVHSGKYTLVGRVLEFIDGWRDCDTGSYVLSLSPGKFLIVRVLDDPSCGGDRVDAFNSRRWNWVQP